MIEIPDPIPVPSEILTEEVVVAAPKPTTYYIRTTQPDQLLTLGVQIGLLRMTTEGVHVLAEPSSGVWDVIGEIQRPAGETQMVTVSTSVMAEVEITPAQSVGDFTVPAVMEWQPTGEMQDRTIETPVMESVCDEAGTPYWHANLMLYAGDLTGLAQAAYEAAPSEELGYALSQIPSYFLIDPESGDPQRPKNPARSFM